MLCSSCSKLALSNSPHQCINCPRFCDYKQQKWCSFCSSIKGICQICAKPVEQTTTVDPGEVKLVKKTAAERIHPFFGNKSGCRSCGHWKVLIYDC